jgi:hypothetical protein
LLSLQANEQIAAEQEKARLAALKAAQEKMKEI